MMVVIARKAIFKKHIRSTIFTLLVVSCATLQGCISQDPYLYDRVGYTKGSSPVAPIGYGQGYRTTPPIQPVNNGYYYTPYAAPQGYNTPPSSRYYSNPYAIPPQGQYAPPTYDSDQYYVPPNYYYNNSEQSAGQR